MKFAPNGTLLRTFNSSSPAFVASGVALDSANNVYVSDTQDGRAGQVIKFSPNGTVVFTYAPTTGSSAALSYPAGLAVDGDGNVWICDSGNNRLVKVSADFTTALQTIVLPARSFGVVLDAAGYMYLTSSANSTAASWPILVLAPNGTQVASYPVSSSINGILRTACDRDWSCEQGCDRAVTGAVTVAVAGTVMPSHDKNNQHDSG